MKANISTSLNNKGRESRLYFESLPKPSSQTSYLARNISQHKENAPPVSPVHYDSISLLRTKRPAPDTFTPGVRIAASRWHITDLPEEVLLRILSYLTTRELAALRTVSRWFLKLTKIADSSTWLKLHCTGLPKTEGPSTAAEIAGTIWLITKHPSKTVFMLDTTSSLAQKADDIIRRRPAVVSWISVPVENQPFLTSRIGFTATAVGNKILCFGGFDMLVKMQYGAEIGILDTVRFTYQTVPCSGASAGPRIFHSATSLGWDMWVFGGEPIAQPTSGATAGPSRDPNFAVFRLDTVRWDWQEVRCSGAIPSNRGSHATCSIGRLVYLVGGRGETCYLNDVHVFDADRRLWSRLNCRGCPPEPRGGHTVVSLGNDLLLFGGNDSRRYFRDTYLLRMDTCTWVQLPSLGDPPVPRSSHFAFASGRKMWVVGGSGVTGPVTDVAVVEVRT